MSLVALTGYAVAALAYLAFSLLLLTVWRGHLRGGLLLGASVLTTVWAALICWELWQPTFPLAVLWATDVLRSLAWIGFLLALLIAPAKPAGGYRRVLIAVAVATLVVGMLLLFGIFNLPSPRELVTNRGGMGLLLFGQMVLVVVGLVLVEQVYRNSPGEQRWGIKFLCLGVALIQLYDFYVLTDALLFGRLDSVLLAARGYVGALAVPMLVLAASRNPAWSVPVTLSRQMVFHTATLLSAGAYLVLMSLAGSYIRYYGGAWGTVLQVAFLFAMLALLATLLVSGKLRARLRVFLSKHFFRYQYDYRDEWLRLIATLVGRGSAQPLAERVIRALGQTVDSSGGVLWQRDQRGSYIAQAGVNYAVGGIVNLPADDPLLRLMAERRWVIELADLDERPEAYDEVAAPEVIKALEGAWLLVPLFHDDRMMGLAMLSRPLVARTIDWENMDLLKTAGTQAASYLVLEYAAGQLADARQFEGFNRLSAFVIHDLKNLIAQLSLVSRNAARHGRNAEFIDDAMATIDHAVDKMNRLLRQLHSVDWLDGGQRVDLRNLLRQVLDARAGMKPNPELIEQRQDEVWVYAEQDRLAAVLGHVVQNAQEATSGNGKVQVELRVRGDTAIVAIVDDGVGMDEAFIRDRLFRPFDSTKGLTGMGIGAYECREFVRALGGDVNVRSAPGNGTRFEILIPLCQPGATSPP